VNEETRVMPRYIKLKLNEAFKFKCVRCDMCCGTGPNVSLTGYDVVRMAKLLRMDWKSFLKAYVNVIVADIFVFMSIKGEHGKCPFLHYKPSGETLCIVYPARPLRCRLYPLVYSVDSKRVIVDPECPRSKSIDEKLIKRYIPLLRRLVEEVYKLKV